MYNKVRCWQFHLQKVLNWPNRSNIKEWMRKVKTSYSLLIVSRTAHRYDHQATAKKIEYNIYFTMFSVNICSAEESTESKDCWEFCSKLPEFHSRDIPEAFPYTDERIQFVQYTLVSTPGPTSGGSCALLQSLW